ncbi:MAG: diguanylate cyclase, partial [Oscillospiraceae bacterium]
NKTGMTTAFPLIFLLIIIIFMLFTYRFVISKKILHPLSLLERSLYMLKKGDLRARYNYNAVNEFGNLSTVFNQTISNLQQATQTLKEREDKNGIILSNITDVVWEYDIEAYTVTMPENWAKLTRLETNKTEFKYKLDEFMDFIHINDIVEFSQRINNCIKNNTPIKFECQLKQADDNYIWVRINGSCMFNIYNEPYNIIGSIFNISDTKNREDALKEFAKRDDMTGLLKKVEMERIVNLDMKQNGLGHSLMILDLDGFKSINDNYGHLIGDEIIINTARVLERHCKDDCYICRFGGDEFIIYTKLVYSSEQTKLLAQAIINDVNSDYIASDGTVIKAGCSIGIARSPINGNNYVQLMSKADTAIYEVKKHGKNTFAFYSDNI